MQTPPPLPPPPPEPSAEEGLFQGIKTKIKVVGEQAGSAGQAAKGAVSPERASEAVRNMLDVMTQVAMDVKREISPEMVKAVDLTAEINLIAFSIGVQIDLEQLRARREPALTEM